MPVDASRCTLIGLQKTMVSGSNAAFADATTGDEPSIAAGAVSMPRRQLGRGAVVAAGAVVAEGVSVGKSVLSNQARAKGEEKNVG